MPILCATSITVLILVAFPFKFCYLLLGLPPNILYIVTKVLKVVFDLVTIVVTIVPNVLLTHCPTILTWN